MTVRMTLLVAAVLSLLVEMPRALVAGSMEIGESLYKEKLEQLNDAIESFETRGDAACPVSTLILTCGDGLCEWGLESKENCPGDCVFARVKSFNRQVTCENVESVVSPSTVEEIQTILARAHAQGQSVRVTGSRHSANRQLCTDGIAMSMEKFQRIYGLVREPDGSINVEVDAGVTFEELAEWLHRRGLSLGYAQLGFRLATIGGAIATGAHGSSHKHSAVVSSLVREIVLVTPEGNLITVDESSSDLMRALRANLGLFGVVVKMRLKVEPQFKLHVRVTNHSDHELFLDDGILNAIQPCDYSFINWFPSKGRYIKGCGKESEKSVDNGAESTLLNPKIPPGLVLPYKVVLHYGMCHEYINSLLEQLRFHLFSWQPPLQKRSFWGSLIGQAKPSDNVVGYAHRMMSSDFIVTQESFFQNDREIAIPMSQIGPALRELDAYIKSEKVHFPLFGVFLRFAPSEDTSLLAHSTSIGEFKKGEPIVFVEIITPEPVGFPKELKAGVEAPFENMSGRLISDFYGRPHWGKNKDWAFQLAHSLDRYEGNLSRFIDLVKSIDKKGLFANEFTKNAGLLTSKAKRRGDMPDTKARAK